MQIIIISLIICSQNERFTFFIWELKQLWHRRQQKPHIAYLTMKNSILHALHMHFSFFDILKTFSFFLRREMTFYCSCVDDVSICWQLHKCSVLSSYCPKCWFQFNSRTVRTHFSSIMTKNNWIDDVLAVVNVVFA